MQRIVYMGDGGLPGPASYLAGIMTHFSLPFEHVPSSRHPPESIFDADVALYILSDYPAAMFSAEAMQRLCERVTHGAGLLMLGGWESYHGLGGDWDTTPLAALLPVEIASEDDRRNEPQLILLRAAGEHPITAGLPFDRPPGIGGYNHFSTRTDARVVLNGQHWQITVPATGSPIFQPEARFPLLVVQEHAPGPYGAGRRACLATDVAPHWIGGFVDWGPERLTVQLPAGFIEVGACYAAFFRNLLQWCLGTI
jgi:uncharacterized membrane protein